MFFRTSTLLPLFWRSRFLTASPHWHHVPLLFWLCDSIKPLQSIVIGAGDGTAHFALCQALDKLGIPGRCRAVGFWADSITPTNLRDHSAQFYEDISDLSAGADVAGAMRSMRSESADLILVDLLGLPEDQAPASDEIFRILRPNGVLVVIGGRSRPSIFPLGTVDSAAPASLQLEFDAGSGLVIVFGHNGPPSPIADVLESCSGSYLPKAVDTVFRRLGQGLADSVQQTLDDGCMPVLQKALQEAESALLELKKSHAALTESQEARSRALWDCQAARFDAETARANAEAALHDNLQLYEVTQKKMDQLEQLNLRLTTEMEQLHEVTKEKTDQLEQLNIRLETEMEQLSSRAATQEKHTETIAKLEFELDARFRELAALTKELERQRVQFGVLTKKLADKDIENSKQKKQIENLKKSISWRVTAPIRLIPSFHLRKKIKYNGSLFGSRKKA